jgi:Holliday junction resolvase-like predicted endonuclease
MAGEPLSAPWRADATERALTHARQHLERLGHRLLEEHQDHRTGARLLVARSEARRELVFFELRAERLGEQQRPAGGLQRGRLRRGALAWLAANPEVDAYSLRFDRLTVFVGHDGLPVGLDHEPQAF